MPVLKKPMKGSAPDQKHPIRFPVYASIKYDGIRCWTPEGKPKSNSNKELPNDYIRRLLESTPEVHNKDFEIILGDPADPLCYNKTDTAYRTKAGEPKINIYIFDDLTDPEESFVDRQNRLKRQEFPSFVRVVKQYLISNQVELDALYAKVTADGHEGLILRSPGAKYKYGRSTAKEQGMLKLKPQADSEFRILGAFEAEENLNEAFEDELGRTARSSHQENKEGKGMLGGFLAKDYHSGVEFRCAPGKLTHKERIDLWQEWLADPEQFKQRIGKYRHFPIGVLDKPRHPRWIGWRGEDDISLPDGDDNADD